MCSNTCDVSFHNLIREEGEITKKETNENAEKLKDRLLKEQYSNKEIIDNH